MTSVHAPRGSLWHRWDPHLHAPGTLLNDQFGGDWAAYLHRIESSEPRIQALGVTDYFSIATYREVRKHKVAGRLPDVHLLFPNVELRIDTKTTEGRAINIHLLFSPSDPTHEGEIERILEQLTFNVDERNYACNRAGLIALGRAHDPKQTDDTGALRTGANQFKTSLVDIKRLFKAERWMRENCLIALQCKTGDGTAGLQADHAFAALRKDLERFADIMFSSRPKDRAFWLGEATGLSPEYIEEHYRCLKPCLHGSDAHQEESIGEPQQERYCWLKGDLTFETLRQAVVEPGERVMVAPQPPSYTIPAETVERVELTGAPWMKNPDVAINSGLVAIIGARGSGKTALADVIAAGALSRNLEDADENSGASFLVRASRPVNHLAGASACVTWGDSEQTRVGLPPASTDEPERVRYLSQHFVERLCAADGLATELREAMEKVVFESTEQLSRLEANSFDELTERSLQPVRMRYADLQEQIDTIETAIVDEEVLIDKLASLKAERVALVKKIDSAKAEVAKLVPSGDAKRATALAALETLCATVTARVEALRRRKKTVEDLASYIAQYKTTSEPTRFASIKQQYAGAMLTGSEWEALRLTFAGDTEAAISAARARAESAERVASQENPAAPVDRTQPPSEAWPLGVLVEERAKARTAVGLDAARQKRYNQVQQQLATDHTTLIRLDAQIEHASGAKTRRDEMRVHLRELYVQVFAQLVEEETVLTGLYAPLRERLQGAKGSLAKLAFVVQRQVDIAGWAQRGEQLFDLRAGTAFKGRGSIRTHAERLLLPAWTSGSSADVADAMDAFRAQLREELKTMPAWVSLEERLAWNKSVAAWLYDTSHVSIRYGIQYEGVAIEHLSPGTRGVVLLLLYLAIDIHDRRPLLIDQPEENLDPNSVQEELVPHFREARKRRQIIIVTHNANLVVNTDVDQVLVASSIRTNPATLPEISYETGSLENPTIRGLVCETLEGGQRAFLERERRYRLRWGQNLLEELTSAP